MAELYEEALSNPALLEMADTIALLDVRVQTLLNEWADDQAVPRWSVIKALFDDATADLLSGKPEKFQSRLEQIHRLLADGVKWDNTWDTVLVTIDQMRKVADTEVKRKKELNHMIPIERVVVLMAAVADAVKRNVTNPNEVKAVLLDLAQLQNSNDTGKGVPRLAPSVINVSPKSKGNKGGRSREALRLRKVREHHIREAILDGDATTD